MDEKQKTKHSQSPSVTRETMISAYELAAHVHLYVN